MYVFSYISFCGELVRLASRTLGQGIYIAIDRNLNGPLGGGVKGDQRPNNRCLPIYWSALVKSSVVCQSPSTGILDKLGHVKNKSCYQRGKLITRQYCLFLPLINGKMAGTSTGVSKQSGLQYTIATKTKITEQSYIK